jgi:hypothetical protein
MAPMFITKKHLSRRTFLRGAGVAVGLPFLEAMVPAATALSQTAAKGKIHMGFVYFPLGSLMEQWTPATEGKNFELPALVKPLEPFKKQLTIVSGLENRAAIGPVHALSPGTWLSCVVPRKTQEPFGGVTADQIAAQHIGQETPLPSLEVAAEGRGLTGGSCDRDYGCSYGGTISFRTPTTPLPMEVNPRNLFERLFGQGDTPEQRKRIVRQTRSILDQVSEEAADLQRSLGAPDRAALGDYLETVREIERRVQKIEQQDISHLDLPEAPAGIPPSFDEQLRLMFDLVALAYQANLTRVFTFMMAREATDRTYNHIGVSDSFHAISHHQNLPKKLVPLAKIYLYNTEVFAKFVEKLSKMPDGDGSMLDHSILLFGSNMSNSNAHNHFPLPTAVIGGGMGRLKGGQHLKYPDHTSLANLLLTLLDRAGIAVDKLGDSTGQFSEV